MPTGVDDVLARATAKNPIDRYPTVDEFVTAFVAAATNTATATVARAGAATFIGEARNTYKGLLAFQEADAADFFGRQRLVARLVDHLKAAAPTGRLVAVIGPSGAGKSSVVRAGLLPALRSGAIAGSDRWFVTSMVPGAHPFEELESALSRVATVAVGGLSDTMAADGRGIARAVKQVVATEDGELLVLIDQFEELFTLCTDDGERQRFISGLVNAITDPRSRLRVVLTMRADFYDRPLRYPELAGLVEAASVAVTPLAADELERATTEPAMRVGATFEPGLLARIVADVVDQPGALPLLQYTLSELFDTNVSGMMTISAYEELGGLTGALARRGEQLFTVSTADEQHAIRRLFTRLVTLGEGTEDTRRRVRRSELGTSSEMPTVIDRYGAARLLAFDRDPVTREQTIEVAHEALLREWPRLRHWLDDNRDGLRTHRHLTTAAATWETGGREPGELYRGGRLETANAWAATNAAELNETETAFLDTAVERHRAEVEAEKRTTRRLRRLLATVACIAAVAVVASGIAWTQQRSANRNRAAATRSAVVADEQRTVAEGQRGIADQQRLATEGSAKTADAATTTAETRRLAALAPTVAESDLSLALLLAAEADQRASSPETLGALQRVFVAADTILGFIASDEPLDIAGFDANGNIVTIGSETIIIWSHETHEETTRIPLPAAATRSPAEVRQAKVSGRQLVWLDYSAADATSRSGPGEFWHADLDRRSVSRLNVGAASRFALNSTGTLVVVGDTNGSVSAFTLPDLEQRWGVPGETRRTFGDFGLPEGLGVPLSLPIQVRLEFFSEDRQVLVLRANELRLFNSQTGAESPMVLLPTGFFGSSAAVAPGDPDRIVVASALFAISVDLVTGNQRRSGLVFDLGDLTQHLVTVPAGATYSMTRSGELSEFSPEMQVQRKFTARVGSPTSFVVSPGSRELVVAGQRGLAFHSLVGSGPIMSTVERPPRYVGALGGNDDGTSITIDATVADDLGARDNHAPSVIWRCDPEPPSCSQRFDVPLLPSSGVAPLGDDLVARWDWSPGFAGSREQFFDIRTGAARSVPIQIGTAGIVGAFTPHHRKWMIHVTNGPFGVEVRDLQTGATIADIPVAEPFGVAGPPDPTRLLLYDILDGSSPTLRTDTWTVESSPLGPGEAVTAVFSPDGRYLLTTQLNGELVLRDGDTFAPIRTFVGDGNTGSFFNFYAFSDDSRYVLTTTDDRARLWDVATGTLIGGPVGQSSPLVFPAPVWGKQLRFLTANEEWIEVWKFDTDSWRTIACRAAGRNLTQAEWKRYGPQDQPYRKTCPQWPAG